MENKLLCSILQYAEFPTPILPEVISLYAPRFSRHLCVNQHFGATQTLLVSNHLSTEDAVTLSRSPNVDTLRALLALPDLEEPVLRSILDVWELCEEDQLRFVTRPLPSSIADQVVAQQKPFNELPRATASYYSSNEVHSQWLRTHPLSDDDLLNHLAVCAASDTILTLQGHLLEHPALRPRALRHHNPALRAAACWVTIAPGDEELAVAVSSEISSFNPPPALGLLAQPNIPAGLRGPLWRSLSAVAKESAIYNGAQPNLTPPFRIQVPIAQAPDTAIDAILFSLANISRKFVALAANLSYLHELCSNPNLTPLQTEELISVLVTYAQIVQGLARDVVVRDLVALLAAISPKVTPALALRRRNLSPIDTKPPASLKRPRYTEYSHATKIPTVQDSASPVHGSWLATLLDTPTTRALSSKQVSELSKKLSESLGDTTTPKSHRAWMIFLSLIQAEAAPTIRDAITTAKTLSRAETVNV